MSAEFCNVVVGRVGKVDGLCLPDGLTVARSWQREPRA